MLCSRVPCTGNACYVSVARQGTKDPGNMDKMLAARSDLRKVQGPRRRCRIAKVCCWAGRLNYPYCCVAVADDMQPKSLVPFTVGRVRFDVSPPANLLLGQL